MYTGGQILELPGDEPAVQVTDQSTILALTQAALRHARTAAHAAAGRAESLRAERDHDRSAHHTQLAGIRAYAIDRYQAGQVRRGDLDAFLADCGLDAYRPRRVVTFTVTGRFEVDADEGRAPGQTEDAVCDQLLVDISSLDGLVEGTVTFRTTADVTEGTHE